MRITGHLLAIGLLLSGTGLAHAGLAPAFSGVSDTSVSIGLRFDFGDMSPQIVGTARHTYTDTNNNVTGGLLDIALPVTGPHHFGPVVRVMGLVGSQDIQGEGGVGFDMGSMEPLLAVGLQGPYVDGGVNYEFDSSFHPYIGVSTYGGAPGRIDNIIAPPPPPAP